MSSRYAIQRSSSDIERAHAMKKQLMAEEKEILNKIKSETNVDTQIWAARSVLPMYLIC